MPQSTISGIIRKGRGTNANSSIETRGREHKFFRRSIRALLKFAEKNCFKSAYVIAAEFMGATGLKICIMTLRRCLHKYGPISYVAVSRRYFSSENMCTRMKWAKKHQQWSDEKWDQTF